MTVRQDASTGRLVDDGTKSTTSMAKDTVDRLRVKVWSPFRVYFDGEASSITGVNGTGTFDILPRHHNFITLLSSCDLQVAAKDGPLKIRISGGVMHVRHNVVTVFLEV
jgi:F0F1-type ATP synthase epsilon subunit